MCVMLYTYICMTNMFRGSDDISWNSLIFFFFKRNLNSLELFSESVSAKNHFQTIYE